jgi:hypothetical protein
VQYTQSISETWNGYVNQGAQEFMNISRKGNPDITLEQAVAQYMEQFTFMFGEYHEVEDDETGETQEVPWSAEELDNIRLALIRYLEIEQEAGNWE